MGFVHVHLIPYVHDVGFTYLTNAGAQFILALVSIAGALLTGRVSDRIGRRRPMAVTFIWRGLAYVLLVLLGLWTSSWLLYAAVMCMGLSWSSTVALLATSCADLYGQRGQGSVFGMVFGVMNWSSTLGVWLPGAMFDYSASYQSALYLNVMVAWIASGVILWVDEWWHRPLDTLSPAV
jgi:MFS family permease